MKYIIIDTCNAPMTVVAVNDNRVKSVLYDEAGRKYNSALLPAIDSALESVGLSIKEIEYIACVVGAGSFTGIRLGVTTANALATAAGAKLISMNAFESIAYNEKGKVAVAIDARHSNYYCGVYDSGREIDLCNMTEEELSSFDGRVIYRTEQNIDGMIAVAESKINNEIFADTLIPLYLKKSQAERELCE